MRCGDVAARRCPDAAALQVTVWVRRPGFYRAVAAQRQRRRRRGLHGRDWHCDDLVALVRLLVRNRDLLDGMETRPGAPRRLAHARLESRCGATRATAAAATSPRTTTSAIRSSRLFLSPDLMYSSAMFASAGRHAGGGLRAQAGPHLRAARSSTAADHVVEIGTGWGGFALHAARHYRLPRHHHHDLAGAARAGQAAGRGGRAAGQRVTLLLKDYRDLRGPVRQAGLDRDDRGDRRAVPGHLLRHARPACSSTTAWRCCRRSPSKTSATSRRWRSVDFIKRFVFPGSFIPSINAMRRTPSAQQRPAADRPAGLRPVLRTDAARVAPALPGPAAGRCARRASTSASSACGSSIWRTAKVASSSARSASRTC